MLRTCGNSSRMACYFFINSYFENIAYWHAAHTVRVLDPKSNIRSICFELLL